MSHRLITVAVVLFWTVMTGLLVRMEWAPGRSSLLSVPVDHVVKLMFEHEEPSDLILSNGAEHVGNLHLQPHHLASGTPGGPADVLAISGGFSLNRPGGNGPQAMHVVLRGAWTLDGREQVQHFEMTVAFHDAHQKAPSLVVSVDGRPPADFYHYQARSGDRVVGENSGTPAALLDDPALRPFGLNPAVLGQMVQRQEAAFSATARRGVLRANGEDIETYDVTIRQGESLESTIQFSQLGQVLAVRTFTGYSLYDESVAP